MAEATPMKSHPRDSLNMTRAITTSVDKLMWSRGEVGLRTSDSAQRAVGN